MTNVKDFGATGDGRADDTDSIQHAVEQGDGHVAFPRGTYRLTRPLEVELGRREGTSLEGEDGIAQVDKNTPDPFFRPGNRRADSSSGSLIPFADRQRTLLLGS